MNKSISVNSGFIAIIILVVATILGGYFGNSGNITSSGRYALEFACGIFLFALILKSSQNEIKKIPSVMLLNVFLFFTLLLIHLVPLPISIWSSFPGRETLSAEVQLLHIEQTNRAISFSPLKTFGTASSFLPVALSFFAVIMISSKQRVLIIAWVVFIAVFSAIWGGIQLLSGNALALGIFANVNHQANFMLMVMPLTVWCGVNLREFSLSERRLQNIRLGLAVCFILMFSVLILTGSIGAYIITLGLGLGLVIRILSHPRWRRFRLKAILAFVSILGICGFYILVCDHQMYSTFQNLITEQSSRVRFNKIAITIIRDHWLFGVGLGAYPEVVKIYEESNTITNVYINRLHNDYLEWITETGILGMAILSTFLVQILSKCWSVFKDKGTNYSPQVICLSVLATLAHSAIDYPLRTTVCAMVFAMLIGLLLVPAKEVTVVRSSVET